MQAAPDRRLLALSYGPGHVWDQLPGRGGLPAVQWQVWDALAGKPTGVVLSADRESLPFGWPGALFSPDGRRLATLGTGGTVVVWDVLTGSRLLVLPHQASVESLAFSPDGRRLLTGCGGLIRVWSMGQGVSQANLLPGTGLDVRAGLSDDGKKLWTLHVPEIGPEGTKDLPRLTVWDTDTKRSRQLEPPAGVLLVENAFYLKWQGQYLLGYSEPVDDGSGVQMGREMWRWDTETGQRSRIECPQGIIYADFSADGRLVAICQDSGEVLLCSSAGAILARLPHDKASARQCRLSPDGRRLAVFGWPGGEPPAPMYRLVH